MQKFYKDLFWGFLLCTFFTSAILSLWGPAMWYYEKRPTLRIKFDLFLLIISIAILCVFISHSVFLALLFCISNSLENFGNNFTKAFFILIGITGLQIMLAEIFYQYKKHIQENYKRGYEDGRLSK
jgi:hypothetical protein